jgi:hypothetical protein
MMPTTDTTMPNDRPNQFKIMLSDEEKAWLEEIATSRGLTASDVLRLYIREQYGSLLLKKRIEAGPDNDFIWKDWHNEILEFLKDERDPALRVDIERSLSENQRPFPPDMGLALNQLSRNGYVQRLKSGYRITRKGVEYLTF